MLSSPPEIAPIPTGRQSQDAFAEQLAGGLAALMQTVDGMVRPMPTALRTAQPATGGWSVDMILEHLCLTNDAYLQTMRGALDRTGPERTRGMWRPSLPGRLLVSSMQSTVRLPSPKSIVPGPAPRDNVLEAFLATNSGVLDLLAQARDRDWSRVRMVSPLSRLVRMNFGDAALVILRHGERHAQQMLRVQRELNA